MLVIAAQALTLDHPVALLAQVLQHQVEAAKCRPGDPR
jgi:hypothetical protein